MKKLISILAALLVGSQAFAQAAPGGNVGVAVASDGTTVSFLNLDASGNLKTVASGAGGGTSSLFGSAFPTSGTALGLSNGTNMAPLTFGQATLANSIPVAIASNQGALSIAGTGTAGTPGTLALTIQGISGGTAVPISGSITGGVSNATSTVAISATNLGTNSYNYAFNGTSWDQLYDFTIPPLETAQALAVRPVPQNTFRITFSQVQSGVDSTYFNSIQVGTGQAVNQSAGNLVITSGTTANSETVLRSVTSFTNALNIREQTVLSQRIAQNNFYVEMVDVIGDGLSYSITNATTVVVTIPSNPFTAVNVGQGMYLGVITGAAGIPQKAVIASVSGNNVTYTVAGWPASGSGTLSVFGWNYYHILYTSTAATNANYDAQRNGWATGDTVATINTTAAPGHVGQVFVDDGESNFSDSLVASTVTPTFVTRASRFANLPSATVPLYLQIHVLNGTSAPASTTTWTLGFVSVQNFAAQPVSLQGGKMLGAAAAPVTVQNTPAVTITSGTVTTVSTVTTLSTLTGGAVATGAAASGNPNLVGGNVLSTVPAAAIANTFVERLALTGDQQLIVHQDGDPTNEWSATSGTTPLATNSQTVLKAAGGSGIRNYCTGIQLFNSSTTVATNVSIQDGSTVIWTGYCPESTTTNLAPTNVEFRTPLKGTAATAMNIICGTSGAAVYYNVQGFQNN